MTIPCQRGKRSVLCLALLFLACPQAQAAPNKADGWAFAIYMQSIGAQMLARTCERADPGYMARFAPLHMAWSQQNAAQIARGEQVYFDNLQSAPAPRDESKIAKIEAARKALASPAPPDSTPIAMTDQLRSMCADNLDTVRGR